MIYRRSGLAILAAVFVCLLAGAALALGRSDYSGILARLVGLVVFLGSFGLLVATAGRWAGYFAALCVIMVIKAALALMLGTTVSVPRVAVSPRLDTEVLLLLLAMICLTFRFAAHEPRSKFTAFSLAAAVAGLALSILMEPNLLPLIGSVGILGASWLLDQLTNKRAAQRNG
jgi:hypothetical protein